MPIYDSNATSAADNAYVEIKSGDQLGYTANVTSDGRLKVDTKLGGFDNNIAVYDAFQRTRVSEPINAFDSTFFFDLKPEVYNTSVANSGTITHDNNKKAAILSTAAVSNSSAIMQTFNYMQYKPARSQFGIMSFNLKAKTTGATKRIGQFDENNGFFLEVTGTDIKLVIRSKVTGSVVDNAVTQANWNIDTYASLDISKENLLFFDYQWLGAGRVRMGFVKEGMIKYCHAFDHTNILTTLYSQTGSLPVRAEITGNAVASMEFNCCAIVSEGINSAEGILQAVGNRTTIRNNTGAGANYPLISLRKKNAYSNLMINIIDIDLLVSSADIVLIDVVKNPTLTGASWVSTSSGYCEYDLSATSSTGGNIIYSQYVDATSSGGSKLEIKEVFKEVFNGTLGKYINGNSESISVLVTNVTLNTTLGACINFRELR